MSQLISGARMWVAGFDLSGDIRAMASDYASQALDGTTLPDSTRKHKGGLFTFGVAHEGFWKAGANEVDPVLFERVGFDGSIMTMAPVDGEAGSPAYSVQVVLGSYQPGGQVGELLPFSVQGEAADTPVRGTILHAGEEEGNVTGAAFQLGEVAAGQKLYGVLHVFGGTGELEVKIRSAGNEAFDTSPTDRLTFAAVATGVPRASEWKTTPGAIAQDWWRIEATNPNSRDFAVIVGIR